MSKPLVTVVIPCFNVANTVAETIASVTAQTMGNFEIVAVDNNCTDATVRVLADVARIEPRLRVVHQSIQGLPAARNAGIAEATGKYIALLDADDLWDPDFLATHLANLSDERVDISYSRVRLVDFEGQPTGQVTRPKLDGLKTTDLLRSNPCTSVSFIVVDRDVFTKAGIFNEEFRRVEDQEWLFRVALAEGRFSGINRVLASYRTSPGALSSDLDAMLSSHSQFLDVAEQLAPDLLAKERRLAHAAMLRYCARRSVDHSKGAKSARNYLFKSLCLAPDLLLREPKLTLKTIAIVLMQWVKKYRPSSLRAEAV